MLKFPHAGMLECRGTVTATKLRGWANGPKGVLAAAVVGGTAARIGGGKFANGAAYGAFSYAVTTAAAKYSQRPSPSSEASAGATGNLLEDQATARNLVRELIDRGELNLDQTFSDADSAAIYLEPLLAPISAATGIELGGFIFPSGAGVRIDSIIIGNYSSVPGMTYVPRGAVAGFHTHPDNSPFSLADASWVNGNFITGSIGNGIPLYLLNNGAVSVCQVASPACNAAKRYSTGIKSYTSGTQVFAQ